MYDGEPQTGSNGPVEIDKLVSITEPQGMWIYETFLRLRPKRSIEIGLGYGFSTTYILAAIDRVGAGHHTAVDPLQMKQYYGVGALHARQFGMEQSFQLLEELGVTALARFGAQRAQFELIYIDGGHRFDDVLVDFTLTANVCPMGGNIILDDMWLPSVQSVVSWIRSNRSDFREISTPIENIAQFERIDTDSRKWDQFVPFRTRTLLSARIVRRAKRMLARL